MVFIQTASFGADKDPYEEWIYDDFFSEDGIVLEPQMVLPVAYETLSSLMPFAGNFFFLLCNESLCIILILFIVNLIFCYEYK